MQLLADSHRAGDGEHSRGSPRQMGGEALVCMEYSAGEELKLRLWEGSPCRGEAKRPRTGEWTLTFPFQQTPLLTDTPHPTFKHEGSSPLSNKAVLPDTHGITKRKRQ